MTWVFTDDHANESEQLCNAGGSAAWYHVCGEAYCRRKEPLRRAAGERLDFIPAAAALGLFAPYTTAQARGYVAALVREGLWLEVPGGYVIAGWAKKYDKGVAPPATTSNHQQPNNAGPAGRQLGGIARASKASRGPGGTFQQPKHAGPATPPATTSNPIQQSQLRASEDPDPVPDLANKQAAAKDPEDSPREPMLVQQTAAAAASEVEKRRKLDRVAREGLPHNLEEALQWAICARAELAVSHPERAEWLAPQKWPEVLKVAAALHEACGLGEVRLATYARDSGVRAIVELFAAGYMPSDLVKAARLLPSDPWWSKEGSRRGLASLSAEVVRRVLATGLSPAQEARVARALGERPPSALGDLLPAAIGAKP